MQNSIACSHVKNGCIETYITRQNFIACSHVKNGCIIKHMHQKHNLESFPILVINDICPYRPTILYNRLCLTLQILLYLEAFERTQLLIG